MAAIPMERQQPQRAVHPFAELLSETAHLLLHDSDPDTLCQAVFKRLRTSSGVDVYFHFLVSDDGEHLELASSGGSARARDAIGWELDFGSAVCGTVARQCSPMYVTRVGTREDAMTTFIREIGVRSYACYPLITQGRLHGTLSFGSTHKDEFGPAELDLFSLVAQQVALATERRRQGERVRQLERLATAGRMSATLAHEINNPLESLGNLLYLLRDEVQGQAGHTMLEQAEGLVRQLSGTVQHTLQLFRGERQGPQRFDLGQLARELSAGLTLPRHARLETDIEENVCVDAVPGELRQVMFNLLMNAAQFTPPGAAVRLTVRRVGDSAEVRVRDEGPGISEKTRAKLFRPFFTTRGKEGTGIGLWLSKDLVERAGGQLRFESNPAVAPGTEFVATLPIAE